MRRLRSAPSTLTKDKAFQRKRPDERRRGATVTGLPTHRKLQVPATQPLYNRFKVPPCTPDRAPTISLYASNGSPAMEPQTSDFRPFDLNASHAEYRGSSLDLAGLRISSPRGVDSQSLESPKKALDIASPQSGLTKMKPHLGSMYKDAKKNDSAASVPASTSNSRDGSQVIRSAASPLLLPIQSNAVAMDNSTYAANCAMTDSTPYGLRWPPSLLYHSEETLTALYMHNAAFGSPLSPHYLSQPETPSIRDFDETWALESIDSQNDALENAVGDSPGGADSLLQLPKLPGSCLSVYHLPEGDHTSAPTLQKMPPAQGLALPENDAKNLVQSWDDGFFQQDEARGDYPLTDLGYLGQAII
ncbi:MAG: hypothetical protein L6R37_004991 [Teloschistes peruensis]|nr:MAG: hypothetical protein L6R37_004991 [Teloschistes peruensis]